MKAAGLILIAVSSLAAQGPAALAVRKVAAPVRLEQFLSGKGSHALTRVDGFRQRSPGDGIPVTEETRAYIGYDARSLYVVFVCVDERPRIRAHMAKREQIGDDDQVSVYLDTFRDQRRAYLFSANPLGVQRDGIVTEGQKTEISFDAVWRAEGRLTADGYAVQFTIPFRSLRFSGEPMQTWGIALRRQILRKTEEAFWPYITTRVRGLVPQFAELTGIDTVSPGRNVQMIPYGAAAASRQLDRGTAGYRTDHDARAGLDAKVVVRDAFTVDAAVNPDFSQVESDDPQVLANRRFEAYFPEKRPFFVENAGYFGSPINLFFSRRIADPEFGARVTGKAGPWAVGVVAADDRGPGRRLGADNSSRAYAGVARAQRELGGRSHIGAMYTVRSFGSSSNEVAAVDARFELTPNWYFAGQASHSDYRPPGGGSARSGNAFQAELVRSGRNFGYSASYTDFSPGFRADLGFVPRVDTRRATQSAGYSWKQERGALLSHGPSLSATINYDHSGKLQDWVLYADYSWQFTRESEVRVARTEYFEFYERGFRKYRYDLSGYTALRPGLSLSGTYGEGTEVNYAPAEGLAPFLAGSRSASVTATLRPSPRLRLDNTYLYTWLGLGREQAAPGLSKSAKVFANHLGRVKANYQFTKALSLRAIADYYSLSPDIRLVAYENSQQFSYDLLLTYLVQPGTAVYIGYLDRYDNVRFDPEQPGMLFQSRSPRTSTGRQFYVKLSYLLQF